MDNELAFQRAQAEDGYRQFRETHAKLLACQKERDALAEQLRAAREMVEELVQLESYKEYRLAPGLADAKALDAHDIYLRGKKFLAALTPPSAPAAEKPMEERE